MAGSLSTVFILLTVFTLSSALSFSNRVPVDDEEILRRPVPDSLGYPGKALDVEDNELRELAEDAMRGRERERGRERLRRLEREREREREEQVRLRNELRRERERERERNARKHETRRTTSNVGFSPDSAVPVFSETRPPSKDHSRGLPGGKQRGREEEIEKERTDHHGRKEKERIHKMERERLRQKKIDGQMRKELEKEMRGHRQRLMKVGDKFREQEERFRARSRARGSSLRI